MLTRSVGRGQVPTADGAFREGSPRVADEVRCEAAALFAAPQVRAAEAGEAGHRAAEGGRARHHRERLEEHRDSDKGQADAARTCFLFLFVVGVLVSNEDHNIKDLVLL